MKVLLISGEFPPMVGGVGDYTNCLGSALHEAGLRVSVLTSVRAGSPAISTPFPVKAHVSGWGFRSWRTVRRAVLDSAPDFIHIQYQTAAYGLHPAINLLPRVLKLAGEKALVAVTFHDLRVPFVFRKAGPVRAWMVRILARSCDVAICTDELDLRRVNSWRRSAPALLVPIGSNIPVAQTDSREVRPQPVSANDPYEGPPMVVGYFGLLNQSKGVEFLLRAYRVLRQRGLQIRLMVAGAGLGDSDPTNVAYARRLKRLAAELDLEDTIEWTGRLSPPETSSALQRMDICVLPYLDGVSFRRGTLMAALAHGLPIVTTTPSSQSATGPRLVDRENCRLVPAGDVGALAEAVEELACSPDLRQTLGSGALGLSRHFTWDEIARKTLMAYQSHSPALNATDLSGRCRG